MDLFKRVMMAVYDERIATQTRPMFLASFFGKTPAERSVSETERVHVDVIRDNRLVAVDVTRGGGVGNANITGIFSAKEYKPPLFWEDAPITASMLNKRLPGVDPFTPIGQMQALAYHATTAMREMALKLERAIEVQAAQALQVGTIAFANTEAVDFGKKAAHSATPAIKWDAVGGDPITDIDALATVIFGNGKMKPNTLIFGSAAWDVFIANAIVRAYLDNRRIEAGLINPAEIMGGATFQGRIWISDSQYDLYSYPEFYSVAGAVCPYVTDDIVIVMNRNARLDKSFAACEVLPHLTDEYRRMGLPAVPQLQVGEVIPFVYEKQPSALIVGIQSAPLVVTTAIDTIGTLINVDT